MKYIFDVESNGFLETMDKIHCIVLYELESKKLLSFRPNEIDKAVSLLENADEIIGHNIVGFDIPAIQILYPNFKVPKHTDTLLISRLIWSDIKENDFKFAHNNEMPKDCIGKHSLKSWGYRLKLLKGDFSDTNTFDEFTEEMLTYCERDVELTNSLYNKILSKNYSQQAIDLEHDFARVIHKQTVIGFPFDKVNAQKLYSKLAKRRLEIEEQLQKVFPPEVKKYIFIPKVNSKKYGYQKNIPIEKEEVTVFNPGSRQHIAERLIKKYQWKPKEYGLNGKPKVDETVLGELEFAEAKLLSEYLMLQKRIGQLAEGNQAWLKIEKNGRIFHNVITNGTPSSRCRHFNCNISQVPSATAVYGTDCRALFFAPSGYRLVGCDASGIELRCLGHILHPFDGGAFIKELLDGDIHTKNQKDMGLETRAQSKRAIYCLIYGGGDARLGEAVGGTAEDGKKLKNKFFKNNPAFKRLREKVIAKAKSGFLKGIDGRLLPCRADYISLNLILQATASLIMKQATVFLHKAIEEKGYVWGEDYYQVAHIHDEVQLIARENIADEIGQIAVQSIRHTTQHFKFRCPLEGEYKVGNNWSETH